MLPDKRVCENHVVVVDDCRGLRVLNLALSGKKCSHVYLSMVFCYPTLKAVFKLSLHYTDSTG